MLEIPNILYVTELAGEDYEFSKRFMKLFKEEFRWEVGMYLRHLQKGRHRAAAEIVGKSKHKLSMLGLVKGFTLADNYQKDLRAGNTNLTTRYRILLEKVNSYLAKL